MSLRRASPIFIRQSTARWRGLTSVDHAAILARSVDAPTAQALSPHRKNLFVGNDPPAAVSRCRTEVDASHRSRARAGSNVSSNAPPLLASDVVLLLFRAESGHCAPNQFITESYGNPGQPGRLITALGKVRLGRQLPPANSVTCHSVPVPRTLPLLSSGPWWKEIGEVQLVTRLIPSKTVQLTESFMLPTVAKRVLGYSSIRCMK